MTISSTLRRAGPFSGNGVATAFPFSFKVFDKTDVEILLISATGTLTTLVLDSDYSVALNTDQNNAPGGTITYPRVGAPMPGGYSLLMLGDLPIDQPTDITNSGGFYPSVIEDMLDRATIQIQQIDADRQLAIHFPNNETTPGVLPQASVRANTLYGFDANGQPTFLPVTASVGAGDLRDDIFISSTLPNPLGLVTFTPGVSTSVTLSRAPSTKANITYVAMDGTLQLPNTISLSGTTLTFVDNNGLPTPIPVGISEIVAKHGTTLSAFVPMNGLLPTLPSVAALRALLNTAYASVYVTGAVDDSTYRGGGEYFLDLNDLTSADNGGTVIRNAIGCWKLKLRGHVPADAFGFSTVWPPVDSSALLQTVIDAAQALDLPIKFENPYPLKLLTGVTVKQGQSATDTMKYNPKIDFGGSTIYPGPGIAGLSVVPRCLTTDAGTGRGYSEFYIGNLTFNGTYADVNSVALNIGATGCMMSGLGWEVVENVKLKNAWPAGAVGFNFLNFQHVRFSRLACFAKMNILADTASAFTGDFIFDTCDFNGNKLNAAMLLQTTGGVVSTAESSIGGIKFIDCDMYGSGYAIRANGYSQIVDIWFTNCQWDTAETNLDQIAVEITAADNSNIVDIHFVHPYFVEYKGTLIKAYVAGNGTLDAIQIEGAYVGYCDVTSSDFKSLFYIQGASSFSINGGQVIRVTGDANSQIVTVSSCVNFTINGLNANQLYGVQHGIELVGANNSYMVTNNIMGVIDANPIADGTTGTPNRLVANNLKV